MRRAHRWALALAGVLLISTSAAQAADGIKASATAARDVPADILVVTFQVKERIVPGEEAGGQRAILAKALEERGLQILERSARLLPAAGAYSQFSGISGTGGMRDAVEVRKLAIFRITGFKRIDDVLDILGRHGVRQQVSLGADHSRAEAVRQELRKEAIEGAIAQARRLAAQAGVKAGGVIDLTTQPPQTVLTPGIAISPSPFVPAPSIDQNLIDPPQPGELPRLRFTVTASVVLAIRSD
jgi:hypothetical protein